MNPIKLILTLVIGYLLGSISTGVLLSRAAGTDIRKHGSGSTGTTNMLRTLGRSMGALTFIGDILKGIIAVYVGYFLLGGTAGKLLGAIAAVIGHNFPCFFGFKGGKGIATSFGCLLCIFPLQALAAFAVFLVLFLATHYVSVGSIAAAFVLPLFVMLTIPFDPVIWLGSIFLGALAIWRHRSNIQRLLNHTENKIDFAVFTGKKKS